MAGTADVVSIQVDVGVNVALPVDCDIVVIFEDRFEVEVWRSPTYSMPKLSIRRQKTIGRHL